MTGFVKLFQSILGSSVWCGPNDDLRVWIALLVLKDRQHTVKMSVPGLAGISRVGLEECRSALKRFLEPDPDSSDKSHEGRKIAELPEGGWLILNGARYAAMLSYEERKEYNRIKQAEYRKRKKSSKQVRAENDSREARFIAADARGDVRAADRIAAEGLPESASNPAG